jgi:hypothetical protein
MAAPADITIKNLNGEWTLDKSVSNDADPVLALQGMSWLTRKAIGLATLTLKVHQYPDSANPTVINIDIDQIATGGIKGTSEKRITDWTARPHTDHIFGNVEGQSRVVRGTTGADGKVRPNLDVSTKVGNDADDAKVGRFLRGEILADGSETEGFLVEALGEEYGDGEGLYIQNFVVNKDAGYGWTAEQVWGFEIVQGERRYTRRIVVAKDGKYQMIRFVYSFLKHRDA